MRAWLLRLLSRAAVVIILLLLLGGCTVLFKAKEVEVETEARSSHEEVVADPNSG